MRINASLLGVLLASALNVTLHAQTGTVDLGAAGWRAIQENDGQAAAGLFTRALAIRPGDAVLHLGAGAASHLLGDEDDAMRSLQKALSIDPTLTVASKLLGEIAFKSGDVDLAIDTYERALVHAPTSVELSSRLDRITAEAERRAAVARFTVTVTGSRNDRLAAHATKTLNAAYWRVAKLVGAYPAEVIEIELNTTRPSRDVATIAAWVDAAFDGRVGINAGGADDDLAAFDRVLAHQLTHAMVSSMAPTGVPAWLHEGLAQLVESSDAGLAERRLKAGGVIPWATLNATRSDAGDAQTHADISLLVVRALIDRIGGRSTALLDGLADGQPLDAALAPFGFSYADLQADVTNCLR